MKKIIFLNKKNISYLVLLLLIIIFILKTNFVRNLTNILKFDENDRVEKIYGYCSGQGVGYLKYLKKKYKIKTNPLILNYERTPPTNWSIYVAAEKDRNANQMVLLNYPGKEVSIKLQHYKFNFYEFTDPQHYFILFDSIKEIKIENFIKPNIKVEFYIKDGSNKLTMLRNILIVKDSLTSKYIVNQKLDAFKIKEKRLFLKFNKIKNKKRISAVLENKYNIIDYKVLDNYQNCYFVE